MMRWENMISFQVQCERLGLSTPAPIERGLELIDVAQLHEKEPDGGLLALSDEEARDRVTDLAIRSHQGTGGSRGMRSGSTEFIEQLQREVREASLPHLEELVATLQPLFETASRPLVDAAETWGFTLQTSSDEVIDLADERASAAWRAARDAWTAIGPIVTFRKSMSEIFEVSPTHDEARKVLGFNGYDPSVIPIDFSVCFAAGHNWSWDGGRNINGKPSGGIDWFTLASGGLRLNSPTEVQEKRRAKADALR